MYNPELLIVIIMGNDTTDRTQAEEALRIALQAAQASNAQYEQAVSMISDIVWRYDFNTEGEHIGSYISPAADRMLGLPVGTIGNSFDKYFSYVHPDDLPTVQETLFEVIRTLGMDKTTEYRLRKADGTTLWVRSKGSAFGRFSVFGTTSDITERKRAEEALRTSEEKYRTLVENANEAIVVAQDGMLKFVNRMTGEITGYSEQELTSRPFPEIVHPEDRDMVVQRHLSRFKGDVSQSRYSFRVTTKNGSIRWLEIDAVLIDWNGKPATLTFLSDITERKRTEAALQESEERYRLLTETTQDMIYVINRDDCVEYINTAAARAFGEQPQNVIGKARADIFPPEIAEGQWRSLQKVFESDEPFLTESRIIFSHVEGWTSVQLVPFRHEGGKVTAVMGVTRDITERKRAEETLRETRDYLENLLTYANAPIIVWNPDFIITRFNRAFENLTGVPEAEAVGQTLSILFPAESRDASMEMIRRTSAGERWDVVEVPILHRKTGSVRTVLWNSANVLDRDGSTIIATIAQGQDITERKQAEEKLSYFQKAVERATDAIGMSTPDGRHYYQNDAFTKLFGLSVDEVDGDSGPPATVYIDEKVGRKVFDTIMRGGSFTGEVKMLDKGRNERDILQRAYSIMNPCSPDPRLNYSFFVLK